MNSDSQIEIGLSELTVWQYAMMVQTGRSTSHS